MPALAAARPPELVLSFSDWQTPSVEVRVLGRPACASRQLPAVIAPVVNHPVAAAGRSAALEPTERDARTVAERIARDRLTVLTYRFASDRWCTGGQRLAA